MQCLGYRNGTNCKRVVRTHRHTPSWEKYQLCTGCANSDKTIQYRSILDNMKYSRVEYNTTKNRINNTYNS